MPEVRAERFIGAPPAKVYALAKDLEGLKPYLKEVESLKVLSREGNRTKSAWVAVAMGKKVRWLEEEEWDDENLRNRFFSPEGDFDRYEGTWVFLPEGEGTRVVLTLTYELTIPISWRALAEAGAEAYAGERGSLLKGLEERVMAA